MREARALRTRGVAAHRDRRRGVVLRGLDHLRGAAVPTERRDLQGPLSVVDDNQKVVGALSVVGATEMSRFSQNNENITKTKYFLIYHKFQMN